jgi:tRNA(fMet)-specific endonuclease VapC
MFCLDTNIWSYLLRQPNEPLVQRLKSCRSSDLCLTEIIRAELLYGALRSSRAEFLKIQIDKLLAPYTRLHFDSNAAEHYAEIRTQLERAGTPISPNDLIIAATVRAANGTLITANIREFRRIPGLLCEDWTV